MSAAVLSERRPRADAPTSPIAGPGGLLARLQPYRQAIPGRAWRELAVTALPFAILWLAMWHSLAVGYWLTLLLALPTAGFLVRLFVIQHDCGHGSFFRARSANDRLGRVIGVLTLPLTPIGATSMPCITAARAIWIAAARVTSRR